jgi:ClpP class serine protease
MVDERVRVHMPFLRVLEQLRFGVWFCTPDAYDSMCQVVNIATERVKNGGDIEIPVPKMEGKPVSIFDINPRQPMLIDKQGIAHINVHGILGRNIAPLEKVCGRTDYADIENEMKVANADARAALFNFDTPGGAAMGIDQTAKLMANMSIPTAGYTETMLASGGVYLAAGLGRIFNASGGVMGSVGAVLPWEDTSQMQALKGRKVELFVSKDATLKGIRPDVSLSEEQRAWLQDFTNAQGAMFRTHLTDYRAVEDEVFKAGLFFGKDAVRVGLADEVGGRDAALEYLLTQANK